MSRAIKILTRWSWFLQVVVGLVLVALLGALDYLTGPEISFSIFYLLPIALLAWVAGRGAGLLLAVVAAAIWLLADLLAGRGYSHPLIPFWNAVMRLGFFAIVVYVLTGLKAARERQDELAQFIVHDLRSPLGNVMTGLQTLRDVTGENLTATQQGLVQMCLVSGSRMLTLITALLDLARLEGGQMPLNVRPVPVKELVDAALQQVSVWAGRNQVTLASDLAAGAESLQADPDLTMRVLVNLLSNAIKFSPPESTVTVRAAPAAAGTLALSVSDHGRGIPPEWAQRVFDKFAQVDARKSGGTVIGSGLGLTFCRQAVEAQGGRIWLESQVGRGTTITFALPAGRVTHS